MKKYKTAEEIPDSEIPDHYDYRNINGFNYLREKAIK